MSIVEEVFTSYIPNKEKLIKYGFSLDVSKNLVYKTNFFDNKFSLLIIVDDNNNIKGKVIDLKTSLEYLPIKINFNNGQYVSAVKEKYKEILIDIRNNCFSEKSCSSVQAKRLSTKIEKIYDVKREFLFKNDPVTHVFRNKKTKKWFAIVMRINNNKLGEKESLMVDIINVKVNNEKIPFLLMKDCYHKAYHMNKKYWITIKLNEKIKDNEILELVNESFEYSKQ